MRRPGQAPTARTLLGIATLHDGYGGPPHLRGSPTGRTACGGSAAFAWALPLPSVCCAFGAPAPRFGSACLRASAAP
eukprot:11209717-Lingulodinium_polyedra.AAC.1